MLSSVSGNRHGFTFSFYMWMPFTSLLIALVEYHNNGESQHPGRVPEFRGKPFSPQR